MSGKAHLTDPLCGQLELAPCTVKAAQRQVKAWHRHLPDVQGGLFASSVVDRNGDIVAVAVAGNPSMAWQGTGRIVISRVAASVAGNACGMLYGSLCAAAKALGYREAWTYTLPEESGKTLRGAGFIDMGLTAGGEWDRPSRPRPKAVRSEPKRRWLRILIPFQLPIELIRKAWCADTSYFPETWTPENPAHGQCAVTSLLVQEFRGGDIWRGMVENVSHYYNVVNGKNIDLTWEQFPPRSMLVSQGPSSLRDTLQTDFGLSKRLGLLKRAVVEAEANQDLHRVLLTSFLHP